MYPGGTGGTAIAEAIFNVDTLGSNPGELRPVQGLFGRMPFGLYPDQFLTVAHANLTHMAYDATPGRTYRFYDPAQVSGIAMEASFGAGRTYGNFTLVPTGPVAGDAREQHEKEKEQQQDGMDREGDLAGGVSPQMEQQVRRLSIGGLDFGCVSNASIAAALQDASTLWEGAGLATGESTTVWPIRDSYQGWPVGKVQGRAEAGLWKAVGVTNGPGGLTADAVVALYAVPDPGSCGEHGVGKDVPLPNATLLGFQRVQVPAGG